MSETTSITGVATVGIPVTDQDRALEFYVSQLGFEARRDVPFGDGRWIAPRRGRRRPSPLSPPGSPPASVSPPRTPTPTTRRTPVSIGATRGIADPERASHVRRARPDNNSLILVEGE